MNRRSLFRILAGATAAAAMDVCGLLPTRRAEVVFCARRYVGEIYWRSASAKTEMVAYYEIARFYGLK